MEVLHIKHFNVVFVLVDISRPYQPMTDKPPNFRFPLQLMEGPRRRNVLTTSRKWTQECSALCSLYTEAGGVTFLASCCNMHTKMWQAEGLRAGQGVLESGIWDMLWEKCWCHHCTSADRTAMSLLCVKGLHLPRFIMCQGKVHKVFLRIGQWEVSPWSSSSGWCTAAYP